MKRIFLSLSIMTLIMSSGAFAQTEKHSGITPENMDLTASPKDDFYQYACGGWKANHPIPDEYSRFGAFDKLRSDNQEKIKSLIEEVASQTHPKGSIGEKISVFYNLGMDTEKIEKQGITPIQDRLQAIRDLKTRAQIMNHIGVLHKDGISSFFSFFGMSDPKNSDMVIAWTYQGGLGFGERDYYFAEGKESEELRTKYRKLIINQFKNAGFGKMMGKKDSELADAVIRIEKQLATVSLKPEELRDPLKRINTISIGEFSKLMLPFDVNAYLSILNVSIDKINVAQQGFMEGVVKMLNNSNEMDIQAYMAWCEINAAASFLGKKFDQENFAFYGKALSGTKEMRPRWKRVQETLNGSLGEALGEMYVEKYFPEAAKTHMSDLVKNLQVALAARITGLDWMSSETKLKALEKLSTFHVKIGFPDKWKDYSSLEIKPDSYYENILRARRFSIQDKLEKIGKPVDKDEWLMTPQTVNAYYRPTTNEICFPAAILQPPFFDMNADDAANYGAIGVVIGHEMTHGFDDQGRLYDKDGNINNWWTEEDATQSEERVQKLVAHFDAIEVAPGTQANGKLTLGENIADNGGIQIAFSAMETARKSGDPIADKLDNLTPEQRFFVAYATVWAGNIRLKEIQRLTKEDPHSLGEWRVNGTLPHIEQFIKAFLIQKGDPMWLSPDKRAIIW